MLRFSKIAFIACLLLSGSVLSAQDILDLNTCIHLAVSNSNALKNVSLKVQDYQLQEEINQREFFPKMSISGTHNYYYGNATDPTTFEFIDQNVQTNTAQLSAFYSLTNLARGYQSKHYLKSAIQVQIINEQILRREITYNVTYTYYKILQQEQTLSYLQEQQNILDSIIQGVENLLEKKLLDRDNLLAIKLEHNRDAIKIIELQQKIQSDYIQLAFLTGSNVTKLIALSEQELVNESYSGFLKIGDIAVIPLELERFKAQQAQQETINKIRRINYLPDFYLNAAARSNYNNLSQRVVGLNVGPRTLVGITDSGQIVRSFLPSFTQQTEKNPFSSQFAENVNFFWGIGLSWQLSNLLNKGKEKNLEINRMDQIVFNMQQFEEERNNLIWKLQSEFNNQNLIYSSHKNSIKLLDEIMSIKKNQLSNSVISVNDYLEARRERIKAELNRYQAIFNLLATVNELKYRAGSVL